MLCSFSVICAADSTRIEDYGSAGSFLVTGYGSPTNLTSGAPDVEFVALRETAADSRIFTGLMAVSTDRLSNFGSLYVTTGPPSTTVSFVYQDRTGGSRTVLARLQSAGTLSLASAAGGATLPVGEALMVTLNDGDANLDPNIAGLVRVTVRVATDYQENLILREIGFNVGVFTGVIATGLGSAKKNQRLDLAMPTTGRSNSLTLTARSPHQLYAFTLLQSVLFP